MNMPVFNLILMSAFSFGTVFPGHAFQQDLVQMLGSEIFEKLEVFVKNDPKSAAAVIIALGSVLVFKDVIVAGAKKTVKTIKENPVVSLGASLIIAGIAYGCWGYYYHHEPNFAERALNSVQNGTQSFIDAILLECSHIRRSFAAMTLESGQEVQNAFQKAEDFLR